MYLSRIALNTKLRATVKALASPQIMHSAVVSSFPSSQDGEQRRVLWRIDYLEDICYLLVLSAVQPNFTHIAIKFGYLYNEGQWESKNYYTLTDRLKTGQAWRFRLCANPVHSSSMEKGETSGRGKIFAHVTKQQQKQWLLDRAQANGFLLTKDTFDVVCNEWKKFRKSGISKNEVTLRIADFEGILTIADVELFKKALLSGIGRAKAYGCGLLTIARYGGDFGG